MKGFPGFLRSVVKRIHPTIRDDPRRLVKLLAAKTLLRKCLNVYYCTLSPDRRKSFYENFAKIFREDRRRVNPGCWNLRFVGRRVRLPVKPDRMWLDWDIAVSLLGHDLEIKKTYASLIGSAQRPQLFIDVGANYGTHSLLFLVHNIETISFEPNPACHDYFREACALNGLNPRIEDVALGNEEGWTELWYPEHDTWHGSTEISVKEKLEAQYKLAARRVRRTTLDAYLGEIRDRRCLLKVDTEGNEPPVLQGALRTLRENRPFVIFESFPGDHRHRMLEIFTSARYQVAGLPWSPDRLGSPWKPDEFLVSPATNFIAIPVS